MKKVILQVKKRFAVKIYRENAYIHKMNGQMLFPRKITSNHFSLLYSGRGLLVKKLLQNSKQCMENLHTADNGFMQ
jgi:hypothetical protein